MDEFSDDGFDDLPENALQALEDNAIQFTQAAALNNGLTQPPREVFDLEFEDDDLDDSVVFVDLAQNSALPVQLTQNRAAPTLANYRPTVPNFPVPHPPSSLSSRPRYPIASQTTAANHPNVPPPGTRPATFQRPPLPRPVPPPRPAPQHAGRLQNNSLVGPPSQPFVPPSTSGVQNNAFAALQARFAALQNELNTAKGEAALLRNKLQDTQATHEAELLRLREQNAEKLAKQERIAEQALAAEKTAETELQFARHDLRDGNRGRKSKKDKANKDDKHTGSGSTTPKKQGAGARSNWAMADGFDDIELVSPSKGATRRAKEAAAQPALLSAVEKTPTRGKRKRGAAMDSPLLQLETEDVIMADGQPPANDILISAASLRTRALPFDFLTLVLDHASSHTQPLTFDLFARYSFPSDPSQTFASHIFSKLPLLGSHHDPTRLLVDFCHLLIEMWSQCLHEKYYEPIYDLVALLCFTLQLQTTAVAPHIMSYLLPVAQATIHLVAIPLYESVDGLLSSNLDPAVQRLMLEIDTTSILAVMYLTALGCISQPLQGQATSQSQPPQGFFRTLQQYWGMVEAEFVVTMLSPKQKPEDALGMLTLLRTSSLPSSVGPITDDPTKDVEVVARVLMERTSHFLADPPLRWAPVASKRQCEIRLAALETLTSFARSRFGLEKLVQSDHVLPRLVTALSNSVDMLYDMDIAGEFLDSEDEKRPPQEPRPKEAPHTDPHATQPEAGNESRGTGVVPAIEEDKSKQHNEADMRAPTELLLTFISAAVSLLHMLVTTASSSDASNVASKLANSHGGAQRYLLTLARLNFAEEDLVLESGIDAETAELANELLDLAVTPDEGEGVRNVFGFDEG